MRKGGRSRSKVVFLLLLYYELFILYFYLVLFHSLTLKSSHHTTSTTHDRYFVENMTLPQFMDVVKANYIATQVNKILKKVQGMEMEHHENERLHWAARKLQAAYRSLKGRRMLKRLIRRDWKKRVDPQSGELFYYNMRTGNSKW